MPKSKRKKKRGKISEKRGEERNLEFCFLRMPEHRKLIFCIWIRGPSLESPDD